MNCIHWTGKTVFELLHIMLYKYSFGVVHFLTILGAWSRYLHCRKNYSMIFGAPLFEECPSWSNESDLSTKRTKPKPSKNRLLRVEFVVALVEFVVFIDKLSCLRSNHSSSRSKLCKRHRMARKSTAIEQYSELLSFWNKRSYEVNSPNSAPH